MICKPIHLPTAIHCGHCMALYLIVFHCLPLLSITFHCVIATRGPKAQTHSPQQYPHHYDAILASCDFHCLIAIRRPKAQTHSHHQHPRRFTIILSSCDHHSAIIRSVCVEVQVTVTSRHRVGFFRHCLFCTLPECFRASLSRRISSYCHISRYALKVLQSTSSIAHLC